MVTSGLGKTGGERGIGRLKGRKWEEEIVEIQWLERKDE